MKNKKHYQITSIEGPDGLVERLFALGLYPGIFIQEGQRGLFGSPVFIHFANTTVALRPEEFACLQVKELP